MKGNLSNVKFIYTGSTLLRCQFSPNRPLCMHVLSYFSRVSNSATLWTVAHQASLSMGFPRQEDWSGLPFSSPGDLPTQGSNSHHAPSYNLFSYFEDPSVLKLYPIGHSLSLGQEYYETPPLGQKGEHRREISFNFS